MRTVTAGQRIRDVKTSYAVTWDEEGELHSGRLELGDDALTLVGGTNGGSVERVVHYATVRGVSVARTESERIGDRPTLVLERRDCGALRIASVVQSWIVPELAERLASLHVGKNDRVYALAIVVPLKAGAAEDVHRLLGFGPPFSPAKARLDRHHVFVTETEAIFFFEASTREAIEELARRPDLWEAAAAWQQHTAGPPRVAESAYLWAEGD